MSNTKVVCDDCGKESDPAVWKSAPKRRRLNYDIGMHGAKKSEQKALGTSGTTHQSEHPLGYEVFGQGVKRGDSEFAKYIENTAPAYQEEYEAHRGHPGTGSWKSYRGQNFGSDDYRQWQRKLLLDKKVGTAIQLNQLFYAHQNEFRKPSDRGKKGLKIADKSYERMLNNFPDVTFMSGDVWTKAGPTDKEKAEMNLARVTARGGDKFPTRDEELEAMKKFGILGGELEKKPQKVAFSFETDVYGIPKDGNCLFHSIWDRLSHVLPNMGFTTNADLRRMAVGYLQHDEELRQLGVVSTEYILAVSQNGIWAGELEAMALAYVWGVRITVHAPKYTITYNAGAGTAIDIYYDGTGHYSIGPLA